MSSEAWFREFERDEAAKEDRLDEIRARQSAWRASLQWCAGPVDGDYVDYPSEADARSAAKANEGWDVRVRSGVSS